jgi:molybdopterin-binding protein
VVVTQSGGLASIQVDNHQIEAASELAAGTKVILLLPYDDVTIGLSTSEKMTISARNRLSGEVVKVFPIGSQVRVTVDCGFPLIALVTRRSAEELGLKKGTPVYATFKAVSTRVIKRH